jgi:hypothetical protein
MDQPIQPAQLSDREARNVIVIAEQHGFRREPDMHPRAMTPTCMRTGALHTPTWPRIIRRSSAKR